MLLRSLDDLPASLRGGAVAIGNFDGVHLGHAEIVARLVQMARRLAAPAVVLTFDPHPARLLRPAEAPAPLTWTERKAELLGQLGADAVLAYPTTLEFLRQEPREFFDQVVLGRLAARGLVEGRSFFFGRGRRGSVEVLGRFCAEAGIPLEVVEPMTVGDVAVSSSRIRQEISAGRIDEARGLLGRPHRIRGVVVAGRGRGKGLGYPTANLEQVDVLLPGEGIYAGQARLPQKTTHQPEAQARELLDSPPSLALRAGETVHPAALSVGPNPTFGETAAKVEAFVLDYRADLYGQTIEIDFLARLRDIRKFESAGELAAQMARDVEQTRQIAAGVPDHAPRPSH
jgi:riboflavin kinase/FMN adenylyltransferase